MQVLKRATLYLLLCGVAVFLCLTVSWNYEAMRGLSFVLIPADLIGRLVGPEQLMSLGDLKLPLFFALNVLFWAFIALVLDSSIRLAAKRARRDAG
jgi:hypothetical protein